jgi:hypothetical protein
MERKLQTVLVEKALNLAPETLQWCVRPTPWRVCNLWVMSITFRPTYLVARYQVVVTGLDQTAQQMYASVWFSADQTRGLLFVARRENS